MNKFFLSFFLPLMAAVFAFTACSESDGAEEEYVDWQATNETYFDNLYTTTKAKIASGDNSWKIYQCWTLDSGQVALHSYDHIFVHVVESGSRNVKPEYNDSVRVHYRGHLLPSKSYASGYVFDQSYQGTFNKDVAVPAQFKVSGLVPGFTTALQHMNLGDRWEVYIPHQLGYGEEANGAIPAYSTLVFYIGLVGIYRYGSSAPSWNAKPNMFWEEVDE